MLMNELMLKLVIGYKITNNIKMFPIKMWELYFISARKTRTIVCLIGPFNSGWILK